jgi:hypothetical protein
VGAWHLLHQQSDKWKLSIGKAQDRIGWPQEAKVLA